MDVAEWLGVLGFALGVGNAGWQVYIYFDKKKSETATRKQQEQTALREKYLGIFGDHLGMATWKAKAFEAHDSGLSAEDVVEILERVWIPHHKNPIATREEILNPMLNELRGREVKKRISN